MTGIRDQKIQLRRVMQEKRAAAQLDNPEAALQLRDNFLKNIFLPLHSIIASYHAMGSEMNPVLLTDVLRSRGHKIALPAMMDKGLPLVFHLHEPDDILMVNSMGISEPAKTAPVVDPDVLLVPLLAFDKRGYRLGYGGGYYDCTLAALRQKREIIALGIGFACQEVADIPIASYDARLDKIVTETGVF